MIQFSFGQEEIIYSRTIKDYRAASRFQPELWVPACGN